MLRKLLLDKVLLPAFTMVTPLKGIELAKQFCEADYEPRETRRKRTAEKLHHLAEHAYRHTAFYRERFDAAGVKPDDIRGPEDLSKIPILTKQDIRGNFPDRIVAGNHPRYRISNTSGTSGTRLFLAQDRGDFNARHAAVLRGRMLFGSKPSDRLVRFTPNECQPSMPDGTVPDAAWKKWLTGWNLSPLERTTLFYIMMEKEIAYPLLHARKDVEPLARDYTVEDLARAIERITAAQPDLLLIYPVYAMLLAKTIRGQSLPKPKVGKIDFSGGPSTAGIRKFVEETFDAPVTHRYGGCEFNSYAGMCKSSGGPMHILEDFVVVEWIKPDDEPAGAGEFGNHYVTCLTNYAMPTLRLEQGDVGVWHDEVCACGRTTTLVDPVGRIQSLIVGPDGTPVDTRRLYDVVLTPGVFQFQIAEHKDRVLVRVVPEPWQQPNPADVEAAVVPHLWDGAKVEVETVDRIQPTPSGKYQEVKSRSYNRFRPASLRKREPALN